MSTPINRASMNAASAANVAAAAAAASGQPPQQAEIPSLSSYIYEHLIRSGHYDSARSLLKESTDIQISAPAKTSPNQRNANGVSDHDGDSKDNVLKRPDDLPESKAHMLNVACEKSFLADWWNQFWDVWSAQRNKPNTSPQSLQYLQHNVAQTKLRQQAQSNMLSEGRGMQLPFGARMPNGMPNSLQKTALANSRNVTPAQINQIRGANAQQMMAENMKRDGSNMELGGQRPQSPSGENAPSPKRQRLDSANGFPGQNAVGNRPGQPGPQHGAQIGPNGQMLMQNGIGNPNELNAQQLMSNPNLQMANAQSMAAQQGLQNFNIPKGIQNGPPNAQMAGQNGEGMDYGFTGRAMPAGTAGQTGNHALQDYQMQLMLLEQQNKKRLLMARQEQDSAMSHGPGGAVLGAPTGFAQGMSPSARPGPSPSPADQAKRGTPQLKNAGLPNAGSPMPNAENRGSPLPGQGFDGGPMQPGMHPNVQQAMMRNGGMMMPGQHPMAGMNMGNFNQNQQQMEMMRAQQQNGGRPMPNGMFPQGGPAGMVQPQGQQPGGQMNNPQNRTNAMPPPPAPAGAEQGRTNPSSPQQATAPAPPTPSQTNKANPKKEKAKPKKAGKKNAANAATPAADNEAATPTPQTPITPMHPQTFNPAGKNGAVAPNAGAPPAGGQAATAPGAPPVLDPTQQFDGLGAENEFEVGNYMGDNDGPLLDNFDFDSFLQADGGGGDFDFTGFGDIGLEATE